MNVSSALVIDASIVQSSSVVDRCVPRSVQDHVRCIMYSNYSQWTLLTVDAGRLLVVVGPSLAVDGVRTDRDVVVAAQPAHGLVREEGERAAVEGHRFVAPPLALHMQLRRIPHISFPNFQLN